MSISLVTRRTYLAHFGHAWASSTRIREACSRPSDLAKWDELETTYFLTHDYRSGFIIHRGTIMGLFSLEPGRGDELIRTALLAGGRRLECFEGYLSELYGRHGFMVTSRDSNWNPTGPDVVWMTWSDRRG